MYVVDVVLFSFCLCACCTVYFIIRWSQKSRKLTKHATFCWRCQMIYCARQCAYIMSLNFQFSFFKWIQFYCFSFAVASHSSSVFFVCGKLRDNDTLYDVIYSVAEYTAELWASIDIQILAIAIFWSSRNQNRNEYVLNYHHIEINLRDDEGVYRIEESVGVCVGSRKPYIAKKRLCSCKMSCVGTRRNGVSWNWKTQFSDWNEL